MHARKDCRSRIRLLPLAPSKLLCPFLCALLGALPVGSAVSGEPGTSLGRTRTTIERMTLPRLKAAHEDVERLKSERREIPGLPGLRDFRAILHAHAEDSSHTGGTRAEMLRDAKTAEVSIILLTDHFRPPRDFIEDSWRGLHDGVLFIPGSESRGFLIHPASSIMDKMNLEGSEFIDSVTRDDGLIFLSHIEDRVDHSLDGLTGMEIYNRHADSKDDTGSLFQLLAMMTDPRQGADLLEGIRLYPAEMLAAQADYPQLYLEKWDSETRNRRVVGIAANDCHHNQVFVVKMVDADTVRLGTIVDDDEDMRIVTAAARPGIREMTRGQSPGDLLASYDFDPYYIFFHNVSTHILAPELTESAVRAALEAGHAYVSHDWMCDPTGFSFSAVGRRADSDSPGRAGGGESLLGVMGDEVELDARPRLVAEFPLPCDIRLIRDGEVITEARSNRMEHVPETPGVYRVEAWLTVDGEQRPWIYSNPIYVR